MSDERLWSGIGQELRAFGHLVLVFLGLNQAVGVGLVLVVAPLLVNEPWNASTSWAVPTTAGVVVTLRLVGVDPTVRQAWVFGFATVGGFFVLLLVGTGDVRLSGSLYPVLRGTLAYVAILAFAGVVTTLGFDDVRRLVKTEKR